MNPADWVQAFVQVVDEQVATARALAARLEDEARVLLERDLDGLDGVTTAKQACIEALERAESERRSLVAAVAGNISHDGLEQLLRRSDPSGRALAGWNELGRLIEACRLRNAHNGRLVSLRRAQVQRSIRLLGGPGAGATYERSGTTAPALPQRDLARA